MKFDKDMLLLYAVTDRSFVGEKTLYEQIEDALKGGVTILQLREKELSKEALLAEAIKVKEICEKYGVPLIINDNLEVALESGADGVHVGVEDMAVSEIRKKVPADFIIGATAKTVEQAQKAEKDGADYLGVGAVFPSNTKKNAIQITTKELRTITGSVTIPAVAIGGITTDNVMELKGGGMCGVAVVSAIFGSKDIVTATQLLKQKSKELQMKMKTALTIAGSDCSGGAGIQADIKTMAMNGVYAMSAITALTAQNTTGVSSILEVTPEFLVEQIDMIFTDIRPDAVKIGMVSNSELIKRIVDRLIFYKADKIVVDPVMVATSGADLMQREAIETMKNYLLPIATLITPNIPEAEVLSEMKIENEEDMVKAVRYINQTYDCAVLLKGGHSINDANDLFCQKNEIKWFHGKRIENSNTHGTGCTLSSAIAANLAKNYDLEKSIIRAKEYISGALTDMLDLGHGSGPLNHTYCLAGKYKKEAN